MGRRRGCSGWRGRRRSRRSASFLSPFNSAPLLSPGRRGLMRVFGTVQVVQHFAQRRIRLHRLRPPSFHRHDLHRDDALIRIASLVVPADSLDGTAASPTPSFLPLHPPPLLLRSQHSFLSAPVIDIFRLAEPGEGPPLPRRTRVRLRRRRKRRTLGSAVASWLPLYPSPRRNPSFQLPHLSTSHERLRRFLASLRLPRLDLLQRFGLRLRRRRRVWSPLPSSLSQRQS